MTVMQILDAARTSAKDLAKDRDIDVAGAGNLGVHVLEKGRR